MLVKICTFYTTFHSLFTYKYTHKLIFHTNNMRAHAFTHTFETRTHTHTHTHRIIVFWLNNTTWPLEANKLFHIGSLFGNKMYLSSNLAFVWFCECFTRVGSGFTRKHLTRLERLVRDNQFTVLRTLVNYRCKKLYKTSPSWQTVYVKLWFIQHSGNTLHFWSS